MGCANPSRHFQCLALGGFKLHKQRCQYNCEVSSFGLYEKDLPRVGGGGGCVFGEVNVY